MNKLERVYAYLLDVETLVNMRDEHFRNIRAIEMESQVITKATLPQFETQKAQVLENNRVAAMQADESFRACNGMVQRLTELKDIETIRRRLVTLRAALKRYSEAQHDHEDAVVLIAIATEGDDEEYRAKLDSMKVSMETTLSDLENFIEGLIPAGYSPNKNVPSIKLNQ